MSNVLNVALALWPIILISGLLFFGRNFFSAWIKRRAEYGFDAEIEKLRGEIGRGEAKLKAELDASQKELDSVRSASLSGATSRQIALESKRIDAAQAIWNAVVDLGALRFAAEISASLKLSEVAKRVSAGDAKFQQFMDTIIKPINIEKLPGTDAVRHRLFVTESVWAAYAAYSSILQISVVRLKFAQAGVTEADELLKVDSLNKIVATALPQYHDYILKHGLSGHHQLVEELETLILTEIRNMLAGKEADEASIRRNSAILKAVNAGHTEAQAAITEAKKP